MFVYGGGGTMAKKLVKNLASAESASEKLTAGSGRSAPKTSKVLPSKKRAFNAETVQVLRDAECGKNLIHYASLEEMFQDLGI